MTIDHTIHFHRSARAIQALLALLLSLTSVSALALDIVFRPVAPGVYAFIGDTGPRSIDNEGLNANIGLVLTPAGAVLIDSGATLRGAQAIHQAVKAVTPLPVKWVINTGGQDHRWLGNGYFVSQGAEVIAHANARPDMVDRGNDHLQALRATLGAKADGTVPTLPTRLLTGNASRTYLELERE